VWWIFKELFILLGGVSDCEELLGAVTGDEEVGLFL